MVVPLAVLEAISVAQSVSELLDILLKILDLKSEDVTRLERKFDIKQHSDFQAAVQFLRLSRMDSSNVQLIDIDLLKKGLQELLRSWNYYTNLNRQGVFDTTPELELVYILSGWLIARCYLKIQEYEGRQELINEAVRYYIGVMEFIQEKIYLVRNPLPPQPMRFFHRVDAAIINFVSKGNLFNRILKLLFILAVLVGLWFISLPYIILGILIRIFGHAFYGKPRIRAAFIEKLNEMYLKSFIEVAPYINQQTMQNIGFLTSTS